MKRKVRGYLAIACLLVFMCEVLNPMSVSAKENTMKATYLGVRGYGAIEAEDVQNEDFNGYLFESEGKVYNYKIKSENFAIQNDLMELEDYTITVDDDTVVAAKLEGTGKFSSGKYVAPVKGTPEVKTIKNLLATALEPAGTTLYIYGGGWNWQDDGSSPETLQYGISDRWVAFFEKNAKNFNYRYVLGTNNEGEKPSESYYPYGAWNQYHYEGLDCSAYVGWALYNVLGKSEIQADGGYVGSSTKMAKKLDADYHYGTLSKDIKDLSTGDIVSIQGHVWMCVGKCADDSYVIIHSTPSASKKGEEGGGVQLSALNLRDTGKDCKAYKLAKKYMKKYYPNWSKNFDVVVVDAARYTNFTNNDNVGILSWNLDGSCMTDPEGYSNKSAAAILKDLFK